MKAAKFYFFSGGQLKQLRRKKAIAEQRKISQKIFAAEISRPYGTIATWESKGIPKIEDAVLVAGYYEVPVPEDVVQYKEGGNVMTTQDTDMPFVSFAAQAIIEALKQVINTKDQIIAEKERVIELIREKLERVEK